MTPLPELTEPQIRRYARHIVLAEIGGVGQARLIAARVLVIGAGGLGAPLLQYLAAAGIGTLGVIDHDRVDLSNLQRQVIHRTADIGVAKVRSARRALLDINPEVAVIAHDERLAADNAERIVAGYDIVADGSDNFATRYLLNDLCYRLKKILVSAAILRFDGQISTYKAWQGAGHPCLRCIFPAAPVGGRRAELRPGRRPGRAGRHPGRAAGDRSGEGDPGHRPLALGPAADVRRARRLVRRDGDRQAAGLPDLWFAMKSPEGGVSVIVRAGDYESVHYALALASRRTRRQQAGGAVLHHGRHPRPDGPAARRSTTGRAMRRTAQRGVGDFETLLQACVELGARFIVCEMGLRSLGIDRAGLRADVPFTIAGIVTLLEETKPGMHLVSL